MGNVCGARTQLSQLQKKYTHSVIGIRQEVSTMAKLPVWNGMSHLLSPTLNVPCAWELVVSRGIIGKILLISTSPFEGIPSDLTSIYIFILCVSGDLAPLNDSPVTRPTTFAGPILESTLNHPRTWRGVRILNCLLPHSLLCQLSSAFPQWTNQPRWRAEALSRDSHHIQQHTAHEQISFSPRKD